MYINIALFESGVRSSDAHYFIQTTSEMLFLFKNCKQILQHIANDTSVCHYLGFIQAATTVGIEETTKTSHKETFYQNTRLYNTEDGHLREALLRVYIQLPECEAVLTITHLSNALSRNLLGRNKVRRKNFCR